MILFPFQVYVRKKKGSEVEGYRMVLERVFLGPGSLLQLAIVHLFVLLPTGGKT